MTVRSHDHELKINTTTDQFTLVRDDNGVAMYQVIEEIPQYRNPLTFTQKNWINGHGQHDFTDKNAYYEGQSIDTTQDGKVFLAPMIYEVYEDNDTELDSAPVCFLWSAIASKWLCATSGGIYRYAQDTTGLTTAEELDATETDVTCSADATTAIPANSVIYIESEQMFVTATGTTLTVVRGFNGTTAATHVTATTIYIYKWIINTGDAVTGVLDMKEFNGYIFAACGSGVAYKYSTNGADWTTVTTLADLYATKFFNSTNAAGTANVLWKSTTNELKSNTSGIIGGEEWTTAAYIGDTSANIINTFLINDELLVGKADNLYHYDSSGGLHPYMDDLKLARSVNNFKYIAYWQSGVYFSRSTGLGEITASATFDPMGPLTEIDDIGKVGTIVGLTADTDYIYVAVDEGTNTHIYKGKEARTSKGLKWQWCPWVFLGTNACSTIAVCQHSTTDKRLWFGYGTHTGYVTITDNPLASSDARFCPSGFVRMSYDYGIDANWDKLWQSAIIETTGGAAGETVQIKYRKDTGDITECIAVHTTNGVHEVNFTSALTCKRIQFEIDLASDTNTATPQVSYFQAKGTEKPTTVRVHDAYYSIGDKPSVRGKTMRDLLRTARTSTTLVKFADLRFGQKTSGTASGDYVWCVIQPGYPKEIEIEHLKGRAPELAIQLRLQEISFTIS